MKPEVKKLAMVRPAEDTDHNFIYATWLRGLYYGNSFYSVTDKDEFMERYTHIITNLLFRPSVQTSIVCLKDSIDTILGYSVAEKFNVPHGTVLHWVFVKPEWRKCGIASALIPESAEAVTHIVDSFIKLKLKEKSRSDKLLSNYSVKLKNKKFKYKPFLL